MAEPASFLSYTFIPVVSREALGSSSATLRAAKGVLCIMFPSPLQHSPFRACWDELLFQIPFFFNYPKARGRLLSIFKNAVKFQRKRICLPSSPYSRSRTNNKHFNSLGSRNNYQRTLFSHTLLCWRY